MSNLIFEKEFSFGLFQTWDDKPAFECFHIHQVHGTDFIKEDSDGKADGIFGEQSKPWAIKTADCLPVLIIGSKGHVFFHAGWRGIAQKIHLHRQVSQIEPSFAFVGPSISGKNFEVGDDFIEHFPGSRNFMPHRLGKSAFDLLAELTDGLQSAYLGITVEQSGLCTFDDSRLNSYRLDKTDKRNWNVFTTSI